MGFCHLRMSNIHRHRKSLFFNKFDNEEIRGYIAAKQSICILTDIIGGWFTCYSSKQAEK